ncbi:hypothetical protein CHLNCDRAFT_137929 [Chlorella variabilis]|uniref:Flagellar associated protein n=1 Tax=Chlorella variabilis TaxID=554065 RepID=E1Z4V3_CHLVA|nr:hypothetical protein CHLNCDRAFT_137929 [Chlorella variabilis]EFN59411.1 hypothetical protein CHLNCDRAFT_137929 [Chlorella variabilis]|eukprot:XP_005851513.1 hypothetical protein CHLNCDRAFT_137929 [Chlorella variabilis]
MASLIHTDTFFLDTFALRQWDDPEFAGARLSCDKQQFVQKVQAAYAGGQPLVAGYAPFCKHIFIRNYTGATVGALPITDDNRHLLQSAYTRRRPDELAVLVRWLPAAAVRATEAAWLDVILYSREQLAKEYEAMPTKQGAGQELPDAPWGIISIKAQDEDYETPMQPITMMRNALGKEEGGSGVPLDREKYEQATAYWQAHAQIQ